jgi:8-oxo-dGTP pyrophosphatase MutT (NUDIX family)
VLEEIQAGLIVSALGSGAAVLWLHRRRLRLLLSALRPCRRIRVSAAVLLRVQDDGGYVLFHSPRRPGSYGPPGGVAKYSTGARPDLERLGFHEEPRSQPDMRHDLRGFVPSRTLAGFARWWSMGEGRESPAECLRRELHEELAEVGHADHGVDLTSVDFVAIRTVLDGPYRVPGQAYRQLRLLEVCDLDPTSSGAAELRRLLLDFAEEPLDEGIIRVSAFDIEYGRRDRYYIQPQSAFLFGERRLNADLPMLR